MLRAGKNRDRAIANRRRSFLHVEELEARRVLAGNVSAWVDGANLNIVGDNASNQILVTRNADLSVTITSIDGTTINGQAGPITLANARNDLNVDMDSGDDVILFAGTVDLLFRMYGKANIALGGGNDEIGFSNVSIWKDLVINTGSGNDRIIGTRDYIGGSPSAGWGLRVGENTLLLTENGQDEVRLANGEFFGSFTANLGDQDDLMSICQTPFHGALVLNGGPGFDTLYSNGNSFDKTVSIPSWEVADNTSCGPPIGTSPVPNPPTNQAPVAVNDSATLLEGASATINLAANDSDPGGSLNLTSIVIVQQPTNGTVTVHNNGTVTYTHNGSDTFSDTFTYRINDNQGASSNVATVTLTITPVDDSNQAPVASPDAASLVQGATQIINVASNDTDPEGQLDLTSIVITQQPTNGTVTVNSNGTVTYVHNGSATTTDTFSYTIKDAAGNVSNVALVSITIAGVNNSPVAVPDSATVAEGDSITINVAQNDSDPEGQLDLTSVVITQQPVNGTLTINPNGTVVYQHNGSETTSDSFRYTIEDAAGNVSNSALVTITVTPVNNAPVASNDTATVNEGGTQPINVAANDSDSDGPLDLTSIVIIQQPTFGTLTVNNDGTVTYIHDGSETTTDSFRYTIEDASGTVSNEATVNLTINPVSDTPIANPDSQTVNDGESVIINVAGNDTDAEGNLDLSSIVITQDPLNGNVTVNPNGTIVYTHDGSETTTDTFRYTIKDSEGNTSAETTVTITITPLNDAPLALPDNGTVDEAGTTNINVALNDTDPDNPLDLTSIVIVQPPVNGTATPNANGTVTYEHDSSETTSDSFTYTIADTDGATSDPVTVSIAVTLLNPPDAVNDANEVFENTSTPATGNVLTNDALGGSGNPLTVSAVGGAASDVGVDVPGTYGTFNIAANGSYTYTLDEANPALGDLDELEDLIDSISYTISDGVDEDSATLSVTIRGATD